MFTVEESKALLSAAEVFFGEEYADEDPQMAWTLNLNDAFYWASADGEYVSDEEMIRVAELFWRYGIKGIYYWVIVEKRGDTKVEFADVNRFIEFVRKEEEIRRAEPSSSRRAFKKVSYTIGVSE